MLGIMLLTYNRREYAIETLRSCLDNIVTDRPIHVHVADDGTGEPYREELRQIAGGYEQVAVASASDSMRGGYGKNYNLATQQIHLGCDYVVPLEDDWRCVRPFPADAFIQAMEEDGRINCIRLGYIGYTQPLRGEFIWAGHDNFFLFDPDSPEPHVFAGHPRLERVQFERNIGPWPENLSPGETEFVVAHRRAARIGVAWPIGYVRPHGDLFVHIGAVRSTDTDVATEASVAA
jgi:hypothetical protein